MGYSRMNEEITLLSRTRTLDSDGCPVDTDASTTVYAEVRSVGYREFYAAQSDAMRAEIIFAINPDEYGDQMRLTYNGKNYRVIRPYAQPRALTELHCVREATP